MSPDPTTKTKIIIVAKTLFSTHGYAGVSMSHIAKDVGITKASLYHFFKNKEDIYHEVIEEILTNISEIFEKATNQKPPQPLALTFEKIIKKGISEGNMAMQIDSNVGEKNNNSCNTLLPIFETFFEKAKNFLDSHNIPQSYLATQVVLNSIHAYIKWEKVKKTMATPKQYSTYLSQLIVPQNIDSKKNN